jgi:hypothetical protein
MEREHQIDVWTVFFVLSVRGNRSMVVFEGIFCVWKYVHIVFMAFICLREQAHKPLLPVYDFTLWGIDGVDRRIYTNNCAKEISWLIIE